MRTTHNNKGTKATPEFTEGEALRTKSEGSPITLTEPQQFAIIIVLTFAGTLTTQVNMLTACLMLGVSVVMTINIAKRLRK